MKSIEQKIKRKLRVYPEIIKDPEKGLLKLVQIKNRHWYVGKEGDTYVLQRNGKLAPAYRGIAHNSAKKKYIRVGPSEVYAHRLVALAWVPGRTLFRNQVDHIDGNKTNNKASNLRWCTAQENIAFYVQSKKQKTL